MTTEVQTVVCELHPGKAAKVRVGGVERCYWCWVDGLRKPKPVLPYVSEEEIDKALAVSGLPKFAGRDRDAIRYNIGLGKQSGSYPS